MLKKIPMIMAGVVLILDLLFKYWVKNNVPIEESIVVWPFLSIHSSEVIVTPFIYMVLKTAAVSFTIFTVFWRKEWIALPLGPVYFMITGIVGNMIYNIKMVETVRWIPSFNVADSSVVISTLVMLVLLLSNKKVYKGDRDE